ncbi:MAG: dipeptide epimerase [Bryobacteraceae bacterium]|nr:dipeptide epimerase [Bryobacteraceae bacterium]
MTRRSWVNTISAACAVRPVPAAESAVKVETAVIRLNLRHTWTTTMSSSEYRDTLHVRLTRDGITGRGEGAPIVRYKEDAAGARKIVDSLVPLLAGSDPMQYRKLISAVFAKVEGEWAAKSAIDIAVMDWVGQKLGVPLYRLLGLDAADTPVTTFSIGIDTPEITKQKVLEAEAYPILKIKVGLDKDESTIEAVRSVTNKPLRPDANEGFRSKEEAVRKINWLEGQGAVFIEQPLPAHMLDEQRWVRARVHIPILADEACLRAEDIPKIADAYDGVVIKLDKTGGILGALRMIETARAHKLRIMLGCMVSSSVTITAAAHLSPMVDYADLDGNLLIANDPFTGVKVEKGKLILPNRPGLGLLKSHVDSGN